MDLGINEDTDDSESKEEKPAKKKKQSEAAFKASAGWQKKKE